MEARYTSPYSICQSGCGKPGEAKMIISFTNPEIVERFIFHCHVVKHEEKHEDKGMMMAIEVAR